MVFHDHLFAVRASVQVSTVSGPTVPEETVKAASAPGEFASALVDLFQADFERLQTAKR
jgi:hypothetical protein